MEEDRGRGKVPPWAIVTAPSSDGPEKLIVAGSEELSKEGQISSLDMNAEKIRYA